MGCIVIVLLLAAALDKTITNAAPTKPTATDAAPGMPHKLMLLPQKLPTIPKLVTMAAVEGSSSSAAAFNLTWTTRSMWQAAPALRVNPISGGGGVAYVIVHHTATSACQSTPLCHATVRAIQSAHQVENKWDDIGYNFLIGGAGEGVKPAEIYEGRGFNVSGAHAAGYNQRSLGVALIGDWTVALPPRSMLEKLQQLISYGQRMGYIKRNYTLLGHRQVKATACPGTRLFKEIKQWPHYASTAEQNAHASNK